MPTASTSRSGTPDPQQQHGDAQSRKRGRKQDDSLPPSRSRDIQRAFRARRAALLYNLEARVCFLERENCQLRLRCGLDPHGEPVSGPEPEYHRVDGIAEGIEGESKAGNGLGAAGIAATADATAGTTGKRARKRQASSVASSEPSPNQSAELDGQRPGYPLAAAAAGGAPSPLATLAHAAGTAASWQLQQQPGLGYGQPYPQGASPQQQQQLFAPLNNGGGVPPSPSQVSYGMAPQHQQAPNNYPNGVGAQQQQQQQPNGVAVGFFHPHPPPSTAANNNSHGTGDSAMFAYHPPPPADSQQQQQQHAAYMYAAQHGGGPPPPPPPLASYHHPNQQIGYAASNGHYPHSHAHHHHQQQQPHNPPTPISHTPSPASAATSPASNAGGSGSGGGGGGSQHALASAALGLSSLQPVVAGGGGAGGLGATINNNHDNSHPASSQNVPLSHFSQQPALVHGYGDGISTTTITTTSSPAGGGGSGSAASPAAALAPPPRPPSSASSLSVHPYHHHQQQQQQHPQQSPLSHPHHLSYAGSTSPAPATATATSATPATHSHSHSHGILNPHPPASTVPASALDAPREYLLRACGLSPRTVSRALMAAGDGGSGQDEEHRFAAFCAAVVEIAQRDNTGAAGTGTGTGMGGDDDEDGRGRGRPLMRIKLPRTDSNGSSSSAVTATTTTAAAGATKVEEDKSQEAGQQRQSNKSLEWNDELCCGGLIDCSAPLFDNTPSYPTPKGSGSGGGSGGGGGNDEETGDSANVDNNNNNNNNNNDNEDQEVASSSTIPPLLPLRDAFSRLSRALRKAPIELAISLSTCSPPPGATSAFAMVSVPGNREDGVKGTEELWVAEKAVEDAIETGRKAAAAAAAAAASKLPSTCRPKSGCC